MKGMTALLKKEMRGYFYSPVAYVSIGIFLLVMGTIFTNFVYIYLAYNSPQPFGRGPDITLDKLAINLYQNMAFILCLFTPFVTMRLFAEERRQQTLELLLTAPLRGTELVLGKFFSAFFVMALMPGICLVYVAFMVAWGTPDVTILLTTYLGMLLSVGCYVALGAFFSALTSSQAIAAVWTFIALLLLWLLQYLGQGMTVKWGPIAWGPVLTYLSPLSHFNSFAEGVVHIKDVVYFLTFMGFALFMTHRVVESNRWR